MNEIIDFLQAHIMQIAEFLTAIGVGWKFVVKPVQDVVKKIDSIDSDTADLLWDRLQESYDTYIKRGYASTSEKERICTMYKRYKAKGRNHLAAQFEKDILALPTQKGE